MTTLHTLYRNGSIRNAAGKLVAFYDEDAGTLVIDGKVQTFYPIDAEHAMDLVAENV